MQELPSDKSEELRVLNLIQPLIPGIKDLVFKQNNGSAFFDFDSPEASLDIKVREERSDRFKDYFVSKEKVYYLHGHKDRPCYVIYFFKNDNKIRAYKLNDCQLEEKEIEFVHKRTGQPTKSKVFCLPAGNFCFEGIVYD